MKTRLSAERRRLLSPRPPVDGIMIKLAQQRYGLAPPTIWRLIKRGEVMAGLGFRLRPGRCGTSVRRECVLVSRRGCERVVTTRGNKIDSARPDPASSPVPPDGKTIAELASAFRFGETTIRSWCDWDPHPALGRKIRSGIGSYEGEVRGRPGGRRRLRGLLASEADVEKCVQAVRNPHHRPLPGNPGIWITRGIFQHTTGELHYTPNHIRTHMPELKAVLTGSAKTPWHDVCAVAG